MSESKRILIVGGVAGGASAAARARRLSESAEIILFERGEHISFANCGLPYHIGEVITDRKKLLIQTPEAMQKRFRIDVRTFTEVVRIDPEQKQVVARNVKTGEEQVEAYDALVLSPGAAPIRPPMEGIDSRNVFTLRNMADMDAIKKVVDTEKPSNTVVVGGGYIGLEMGEAIRERGLGVTMIELAQQVMGPADPEMAALLHQQLQLHGVDLRLGVSVAAIQEEENGLSVKISSGDTVSCGMVVLAIGVKPEVTLASDAGLKIGERGGIVVDRHMRTSDPSIYAVGDAVEVTDFVTGASTLIPLAGPANRQGRIAADNIFGRDSVYKCTQGTAICKVFDLAIGMTGASEKVLKRAKMAYEKVYVHPSSHAGYYPGAAPLTLKVLFDPQSGKLLGAQAVGKDGVDKRIDVLAVALRAGLTVYDLEEMELSYAPPYGSAKDPVNYAGFAAANVLRGDVGIFHIEELDAEDPAKLIVDVRTPKEFGTGQIPGAVNIPVDDLRERLDELPRDKEILAYCGVGLRGYLACRILSQNGFRCRNLTGGMTTYKAAAGKLPKLEPEKKTVTPAVDVASGVDAASEIKLEVDACGLQCPGPIMRLAQEIQKINPGEALSITVNDPGFASDVGGWCHSTGNRLVSVKPANGGIQAVIERGQETAGAACSEPSAACKDKTIVVFSNDFDRAMAAFIIANGAAAMGSRVTLFFTFWGLNILRKNEAVPVQKNLVEKMFGWMMPRGAEKLQLSKMNMGGMGLLMMKDIMRKKHVATLPELIESAKQNGVKLVACAMSMDLMGIKREELIDGVEEGGVAMYLDHAEQGRVNLFI